MNPDERVSVFEFGRITGLLEALEKEVKSFNERILFRTDNLETRIEVIEKATAKDNVWVGIVERALYGGVGVLLMLALKGMGYAN